MTTLCLMHRAAPGITRDHVRQWATQQQRVVERRWQDLGLTGYRLVQRLAGWHPVQIAGVLSRSRPVRRVLGRAPLPPPLRRAARDDMRWDVVEILDLADTHDPGDTLAVLAPSGRPALFRRTDACLAAAEVVVTSRAATTLGAVYCIRPPAHLGTDAMHSHWRHRHRPLVAGLQDDLHFSSYRQLFCDPKRQVPAAAAERAGITGSAVPLAAVAELGYPDENALLRRLADPGSLRANLELVGDETRFIDADRSSLVMGRMVQFP